MSKPIPRRMLPHVAVLSPYIGTIASVRQYGTDIDLSFVRFEPVRQTALTSLGDSKNDRFTMYYDCINSMPRGTVPKQFDKISFQFMMLTVRYVKPCYGDRAGVHHYEVNCI